MKKPSPEMMATAIGYSLLTAAIFMWTGQRFAIFVVACLGALILGWQGAKYDRRKQR